MSYLTAVLLVGSLLTATAQQYELLIKGGHVMDPKNNVNEVMDVAISDHKVMLVQKTSPPIRQDR